MFYEEILQPLCHTHCVMLKIFQLDFNNPAVNTFFTATKIFSHSRCNNGVISGKLFCDFILSISRVHHLNTWEYFYVKILPISRVQHLNSSKIPQKNNPTQIELFSM